MLTFNQSLSRPFIFICLFLIILMISWEIVRSPAFAKTPELTYASLFDLTVFPDLIFYFLVARPAQLSVLKTSLAAVAMIRIALFVIPIPFSLPYFNWTFALMAIEAAILLVSVYRINLIIKQYKFLRKSMSAGQALEGGVAVAMGARTGNIFTTEIRVLYYSLFWPAIATDVPVGSIKLTTHKKSAQKALMTGLIVISFIETVTIHMLLYSWSHTAALWVSGLSFYGILFIARRSRCLTQTCFFFNKRCGESPAWA